MSHAKEHFRSLKHFINDGLWSSVCAGIAESNFSAFAVLLSATTGEIGFLAGSQQLAGCWLQLWAPRLTAICGGRKRLVLGCVALQSIFLALMVVGAFQGISVFGFISLAIGFSAVGDLGGPIWSAWVSDLLPARRRGACFAIRNQKTYPANFISIILGGIILERVGNWIGGIRGSMLAFCAIFLLGLIAKILSLKNLYEQQAVESIKNNLHERRSSAWSDPVCRRAMIFFGVMGFGVNLCGPFQVPFLLKVLNFNYLQFTFITAALSLARFLAAAPVGRLIDRLGSRTLLTVASVLMPLIPLGWAISSSYYAVLGFNFFAGFIWAMFDMCTFTYLTESTSSQSRARVFAARQVAWNLMSFVGAALGGLLLTRAITLTQNGYVVVFWASVVGRTVAAGFALRLIAPMPRLLPVVEEELREAA